MITTRPCSLTIIFLSSLFATGNYYLDRSEAFLYCFFNIVLENIYVVWGKKIARRTELYNAMIASVIVTYWSGGATPASPALQRFSTVIIYTCTCCSRRRKNMGTSHVRARRTCDVTRASHSSSPLLLLYIVSQLSAKSTDCVKTHLNIIVAGKQRLA